MPLKPEVIRFKFCRFRIQPSQPGDSVTGLGTDSRGDKWHLDLYPGGPPCSHPHFVDATMGEDAKEVDHSKIGLYLSKIGTDEDLDATMTITVRDAAGNAYHRYGDNDIVSFIPGNPAMGYSNLVKRSEIIDEANKILVRGALLVDVELQEVVKPNQYRPSNPFAANMFKLVENENGADVSFKFGDVIIPAHKLILKMNAPILLDFCDKHDGGAPIPIENTHLEVFRHILCYVYGGGEPEPSKMRKLGRELIDAADRYGMVDLKIAVETALVELRILNVENVVDWILYAEARTCPLLKEYAMSYISGRAKDILADDSSKTLMDSPLLVRELMIVISDEPSSCIDGTSRMTVDNLRMNLNCEGLDVDGSKEMLVSRLEESNKRLRTV